MKTRIYISNDTSARAAGAGRLAEAWESDPRVTLVRTSSRGAFFLEPMVERDGPKGRLAWPLVKREDLPRILAGEGGLPIGEIPFLAQQRRITFASFGSVRPLSLEDYHAHEGWGGLRRAQSLGPQGIIDELKRSRLRGRGGAAFPVWRKWQTAKDQQADAKYVIANAEEGDAGTYCDRMIMEGDPFRLLEGMVICARAIGAQRGYIYCRHEYPAAYRTLQQAIMLVGAAGFLDLDGRRFEVDIVRGAGSYVCGEETALVESLEGHRGQVRAKPPYPAVAGLHGCPTIVSNVLTFATVPSIVAKGGEWYASHGTETSRGTVVLQLGGRVKQPGLVEIPFGATLDEVLHRFGGGMSAGARFKALQVGGPLGSLFSESHLGIRLCYEAFADAGSILGHGGIVVFDDETDMVDLARHYMAFVADESCGKCTPCRVGSVRGRELLDHIQAGQGRTSDLALIRDLGETMKATSLCALGGRAPYPVLTAMDQFSEEFRAKLIH